VNHLQGQSVISVALKTTLQIRLGICISGFFKVFQGLDSGP